MESIINIKRILVVLIIAATWISCSDNTKLGLPSKDGIAPSEPKVLSVRNLNGGAVIHYQVPVDEDLLCVTASYVINEKVYETKVSPFVDSLKVEGFGTQGKYIVNLKSVDKSRNESSPVEVTISPEKAPVELIYESLDVKAAFGGISITWDNPTESNIIVGVSYKDSIGEWSNLENFYSSTRDGKGIVRNLDTIPKEFSVVIRDRWDNYSQELVSKLTPLFEEQVDSKLFREIVPLPYDCPAHASGPITKLWDNNMAFGNSFFTTGQVTESGIYRITFDLGQIVKLSRFKTWQYYGEAKWVYNMANVRYYAVYGCEEITAEMRETGTLDGWTVLFDGECYKPSGEGPVTNEDKQAATNGDEHEVPLDAPVVRYIRLDMKETWGGSAQRLFSEMRFWGQIQK